MSSDPVVIAEYKFNDPEIDDIEDFDYCARLALIEGDISKKDYLLIEEIRRLGMQLESGAAIEEVKEIFASW